MTIQVANTVFANTFGHWLERTNEIAHALSTKVLTADSNTTIGNVSLQGTFTANVINVDTITSTDGSTEILAANLVIQSTGGLVTLGIVNIKNDIVIDAVSKIQIPGANSTHNFLAINPATGNAEFTRVLIPIDQLTDVDTTNAAKDDTSILVWNTGTGKWQSNTLSLINSTRINTLNVGTISSNLVVNGNTTLSNNTVYVYGNTKRVGIGISSPNASLHVNGAILATGDIQGFQTSDRMFKKNIEVFQDKEAFDLVMQFTVKQFDWDEKKVKKSKYVSPNKRGRDVGLIAQEAKEVLPRIVHERDDGTMAVDYEATIPYLIAAVQHLGKKMESMHGD